MSMRNACARYGIGSLVNTVTPFRLGDAVRVSRFAQTLVGPARGWTAGGALGAGGESPLYRLSRRGLCWDGGTAAVAGGGGGDCRRGDLIVAVFVRRRESSRRVGHLLDAFRGLGQSREVTARLVGSVAFATTARVLAAAAICASFGLHSPLVAALLVVATLDLSGQIP